MYLSDNVTAVITLTHRLRGNTFNCVKDYSELHLELQKADVGKISPIIKDLTQDEVDPETKQLP